MKYLISLSVTFSLLTLVVNAQEYPRKNIDQSRISDELFGFQDQDINYEQLYENIVLLLSNPININKASDEELRFLNILSESQIQNLLKYRKENGNLVSIYELQAIPDLDLNTIYKMVPFVEVTDPFISDTFYKRAIRNENNYFITRCERTLENKDGFIETDSSKKFKGGPDKTYFRFRTSKPGDFSFGFTAEKDAGEIFNWSPATKKYGFDFLSFHAQVQNKGRLKNLIVGDYQNQFGQGLMLGGVFGMGKGAETITTTRRSTMGMLPYTSTNEFGLLHGVTATYEITKGICLSGFFSRINRDASLTDTESETSGISSFQTSGLHRNETELQNRKKIMENNQGLVLQYKKNNLDAGLMYNYVKFEKPVVPKSFLYNQFAFHGTQNENVGLFLNYNVNNFLFFGEISKSLAGGAGAVAGVMGSLTNHLDVSLLYRKYNRNFYTFYSNGFSEGTTPQNESGIYWGCKYKWTQKLAMAGYMDFFRFPWLRFRSYSPSAGHEWLLRLSYQPSKQVIFFVQAREEKKVRNTDLSPTLYVTSPGIKRNYWINCEYGLLQKLKMKTRAQFSTYQINQQTTRGFALIQDITVNVRRFECTARHALFDTDDYDNRQYAYEKDVWLAYSLPAYYGVGVRNFILIEYKASKNVTVWARYGRTRYTDREEIGSGEDRIAGNTKNDIKFQVRFKL